ncbi:MAG TPA: RluA family pseudouridine synthase [Saprospiraceae bacterium]|nr:RluA family pseudouridine synthase [Saprospiraceae bacterium]HQW56649.1 RluA family pseudouridine synthase [Saprospiraceae bacterium]
MMVFSELILAKNHQYCIINKPAGVPLSKDKTGDTALIDLAEIYFKQPMFVVHRIDRPVSGVVILAKNQKSAAYFSQLFHDKKIEKEYLALIEGSQFTGSGELQHFISPKISAGNKSRIIEDTEMEHNAETSFTILGNTDKYSIILLKPHTGRHHQLRAQLASTMSPIKGDVKYGARRGNKDRSIYLHAYRIRFPHPVSGEEMIYVAPPPKDVLWDLTSPLIEIIN